MEEILDQEIHVSTQTRRQIDIDGARGVLINGILSIILMGGIGLIIALVNISRAKIMIENYNKYPGKYTESSYKQVISGRLCSYISLAVMGIFILMLMVLMSIN